MEENEIRLESTAEENLPYELALSLEGEKPFFFFFFTRVWRLEFSKKYTLGFLGERIASLLARAI